MNTYLIIENGVVTNSVLWDGEKGWKPATGKAVLSDGVAGIGWSYDGAVFTAPTIPALTPEQLIDAANAEKYGLINMAANVIAPLKDASDGGYIDDADKPKLTAWQKYRYALTKVDPAKPVWPEKPAE